MTFSSAWRAFVVLTVLIGMLGLGPSAAAQTSNATLQGTITDDGLPVGSNVAGTWSKVSGPGNVTFADSHSPNTTVTFAAPGSYVLRLKSNR